MPDDARLLVVALLTCLLALVGGRGQTPPAALPRPTPVALDHGPAPVRDQMARLRQGRRLDVNAANAGELQLLPGVGPALAERIVADRKAHGAFRSLSELTRVRGIGPHTLARIKALAAVGGGEQAAVGGGEQAAGGDYQVSQR